jgi:hypothetical protein
MRIVPCLKLSRKGDDSLIMSLMAKNVSTDEEVLETGSSMFFDYDIEKFKDGWEVCYSNSSLHTQAIETWRIPGNQTVIKTVEIPSFEKAKEEMDLEFTSNLGYTSEDKDKLVKSESIDFDYDGLYKFNVYLRFMNKEGCLSYSKSIKLEDINEKEVPNENIQEFRITMDSVDL